MSVSWLSLILILLEFSAFSHSQTDITPITCNIYISPTGNSNNTGTENSPFPPAKITGNSVVCVLPGNYGSSFSKLVNGFSNITFYSTIEGKQLFYYYYWFRASSAEKTQKQKLFSVYNNNITFTFSVVISLRFF